MNHIITWTLWHLNHARQSDLFRNPITTRHPTTTENTIKELMKSSLKIPPATVNVITFHCVHCLTSKDNKKPPAIIAKFEHYKPKELVKSKGKELKDTTYGLNDKYPKTIQERRTALLPIMKQLRRETSHAICRQTVRWWNSLPQSQYHHLVVSLCSFNLTTPISWLSLFVHPFVLSAICAWCCSLITLCFASFSLSIHLTPSHPNQNLSH